jgi:predicted nucleic acid-binding protein
VTSLVLDASITMCWCFEEEATPATDQLPDRLMNENAAVPAFWALEVANVLALAERRRRITPADASEFIELLATLMIDADQETAYRAFGNVLGLARTQHLTAYDAAYLDLAMRLGVPLATKDAALGQAALLLGVPLLAAD